MATVADERAATTLSEDQRDALSVTFTVGEPIPEESWEEYGLWK